MQRYQARDSSVKSYALTGRIFSLIGKSVLPCDEVFGVVVEFMGSGADDQERIPEDLFGAKR